MNLESHLKRLGFATAPIGGLQLAVAVTCLGAVALFLVGGIGLALLAAFGTR